MPKASQLAPVLSRLLSKERLAVEDKREIKRGKVKLGKYVITGRLGHGGMGAVLAARDEGLGREVALKCLPPDAEEVIRARFEREAQALARLDHPNIVRVHAYETAEGVSFLVLERVRGKSLEQQIRTHGTLEEPQAWRLIRHVTRAMEAAEAQQILHRDLKPGNVLWVPKPNVYKVCDFGLVRFQGAGESRLTVEGTTMGTPFYMSPEQVRGDELDSRSDMYSLGMTIHEALTGEVPFEDGPLAGVLVRRLEQDVPSLRETYPDASDALVELVDWLTRRRRKDRPRSWADLAGRLNVDESGTGSSDDSGVAVLDAERPPSDESQDPDALEADFAAQETRREPKLGEQLGNYRLDSVIGRGGMGVIYKATHVKTGDVYAVKALVVGEGPDGERRRKRFETEVEALRRLEHENVVRVYTYGRLAPTWEWYAMDYVDGRPLEALLAEQALNRQERLQIFLQICKAIEHAHARNVVHRDLKPANVLIDASNQAHVLDFGLAKIADEGKTGMTRTSSLLGTPYYMAPEQFLNPKGVDKRTDVWALGVMLFEMLVGQRPFVGETAGEVSYKIMHQNPPRASKIKPNLSKRFDAVVARALERDPEHRYESVKALKKEVIAYRRGTGREETRTDRIKAWIWRWYRQHKVGFLVGTVFGLLLSLPVILFLYWLLPR